MSVKLALKLYITGHTPRSEAAVRALRLICNQLRWAECDLAVIDTLEQPELADRDRILATPTLIKLSPLPARRVVGDLSNPELVIQALGLNRGVSGSQAVAPAGSQAEVA